MRKLSTILMAVALVLGMAQCKKEQPQPEDPAQGEKVFITLDVNGNNGGSKVNVDPLNGKVTFEEGDVIYVGNKGTYVGKLTCSVVDGNPIFSGEISNPDPSDYLHFFFAGNCTIRGPFPNPETPNVSEWSSVPDAINHDQRNRLHVFSYGHSEQKYDPNVSTYKSTLKNQCALVKFVLTNPADTVCLWLRSGCVLDYMYNRIADTHYESNLNTSLPSRDLYPQPAGSNEYWAVVFPSAQKKVSALIDGRRYAVDMPEIKNNDYITEGIVINNTPRTSEYVEKAFSVSNTSTVYFSRGNLQATWHGGDYRNWTWDFAANQWDFIGFNSGNLSKDDYESSGVARLKNPGKVDLFGRSCITTNYYGISKSTNQYNYSRQFRDWGGLVIGSYAANTWRTMTKDEWQYLLFDRPDAASKLASANVNGVIGCVLLPDDWSLPAGCSFTPGYNRDWAKNTYGYDEWATMEFNGAVFLPMGGFCYGNSMNTIDGKYQSSTYDENGKQHYAMFGTIVQMESYNPQEGHSVRLVRDAE